MTEEMILRSKKGCCFEHLDESSEQRDANGIKPKYFYCRETRAVLYHRGL